MDKTSSGISSIFQKFCIKSLFLHILSLKGWCLIMNNKNKSNNANNSYNANNESGSNANNSKNSGSNNSGNNSGSNNSGSSKNCR